MCQVTRFSYQMAWYRLHRSSRFLQKNAWGANALRSGERERVLPQTHSWHSMCCHAPKYCTPSDGRFRACSASSGYLSTNRPIHFLINLYQSMFVPSINLPTYLLSYLLAIYLSFYLSIYLSLNLFFNLFERFERKQSCETSFKVDTSKTQHNYARFPLNKEVDTSKTKKFCKTFLPN